MDESTSHIMRGLITNAKSQIEILRDVSMMRHQPEIERECTLMLKSFDRLTAFVKQEEEVKKSNEEA